MMKIKSIAPWFGSNRMLGQHVAEELAGCKWVGIPFAGSMAEIPHIKANTIVVNDLHENVINLGRVIANREQREELIERLSLKVYHPQELAAAQMRCIERMKVENLFDSGLPADPISVAEDYFVAVWMGRSGRAGTNCEFKGYLPVRWNANGGDSNTRYRSAIASIEAWGAVLENCNFRVMDVFDFLENCKDEQGHGIYCDPPFPDAGDEYRHKFDDKKHAKLEQTLSQFSGVRVVCRFYDHPLIRELYSEPSWTWRYLSGGRDQANQSKPEVLIMNGPSYAG